MGSDQYVVVVYPLPGNGPPYALVASGESGVAAKAMPVTVGEEASAPSPDGKEDPAAAMVPERRTEQWRKSD